MGTIFMIFSFGWLAYQLIKDACITVITKNQDIDFHQAYTDSAIGKCNVKALDNRLENGYYSNQK